MARRGAPARLRDDSGSALVEFVAMSLLLLIPILYLIVALARVQAGLLAAEEAAHAAARAAVVEGVEAKETGQGPAAALAAASAAATGAVELTAGDFGFEDDEAALELICLGACLEPGQNVSATVTITVELPGIPSVVAGALPLEVEVSASALAAVDSVRVES